MGKLPLKEILTVLLISHLSILIAGQLGKPKEPVLGAEANWSVELGKLRGGTGAVDGRESKERQSRACEEPERPRSPSRCGGSGRGGPTDPRLR